MNRLVAAALSALICCAATFAAPVSGQYRNFRVAIYVVVNTTKELADPRIFAAQYAHVARQLKFDKVYIEVYRNHVFATADEIEKVKGYFAAKGIAVAGGVTLAAGGHGGQFGTFDYESKVDRDECRKASELAAAHFGEVILDDFFFTTTKSAADIAAKGTRSWSAYRLDTMRDAAQNLVIAPAKAVNPAVKMVIKYPNWYEHFQGLGYDLDQEAKMFDGIYAGTETRDPTLTDQLLQQYESYEIIRYFSNIRPHGGLGGGWVDTYSLRDIDRYIEQLQDTLFAKAGEITLFNWVDMAESWHLPPGMKRQGPLPAHESDWINKAHYGAMRASYRATGKDDPGPGWARAAGYAFESMDEVLSALGTPVGIAAYKPYQSVGEDFLHNYLGNIGLPIELGPNFPLGADLILITESAKFDPTIIDKIKQQLHLGKNVVVTSGFLRAMQDKGFQDLAEWEDTGRKALISDFVNGFGAGNGVSLNDPNVKTKAILFPEIRFFTNDSWAIMRGQAGAKGYPLLISNTYDNGTLYLLTVPENPADLYRMPQGALTQWKRYLLADAKVRLEAPALVSLMTYDNDTLVVQSFNDGVVSADISLAGANVRLRDLVTGEMVAVPYAVKAETTRKDASRRWSPAAERSSVKVRLAPHSWRAFRIVR